MKGKLKLNAINVDQTGQFSTLEWTEQDYERTEICGTNCTVLLEEKNN
jgi:hypothetical protein